MGQYIKFDPSELVFLNSFFLNFRCGNEPHETDHPEGICRYAFDKWYEMKEIDFLACLYVEELRQYCAKRSEKRLNQTFAEFFGEIDRTIVEVGMTVEDVAKEINVYRYECGRKFCGNTPELAGKIYKFLAPIYTALRNKGYNPADLLG